jgi:hypothetical protein
MDAEVLQGDRAIGAAEKDEVLAEQLERFRFSGDVLRERYGMKVMGKAGARARLRLADACSRHSSLLVEGVSLHGRPEACDVLIIVAEQERRPEPVLARS